MSRKICYITGTRADFGLIQSTLQAIYQSDDLTLSIIVTGTHLADQYGSTIDDIVAAGLPVSAKVVCDLAPPSGATMARNIGIMLIGFVDALNEIKPDLVLLLGDRGEMLAGALAAIHLNIHIAHIHGGERSGSVDEPIRHAISKLSHFHFTATKDAQDRLVRMGEPPERIFVTGAPGLDGIEKLACLARKTLMTEMGLDLQAPVALMVYHPVLQEVRSAEEGVLLILNALRAQGVQVVALMPNSDAGSDQIRNVLKTRANEPGVRVVTHFPRERFISWIAAVDLMIGNSSAGIIEAASFGTSVINIGSRQNLRERNTNTIDSSVDAIAIESAVALALAHGPHLRKNIYGDGHASRRIVDLLKCVSLDPTVLVKLNAY
jgi:GDP/UDP-N,N'-diacetylbacillosamine 2-epimerase (hydrolysing)